MRGEFLGAAVVEGCVQSDSWSWGDGGSTVTTKLPGSLGAYWDMSCTPIPTGTSPNDRAQYYEPLAIPVAPADATDQCAPARPGGRGQQGEARGIQPSPLNPQLPHYLIGLPSLHCVGALRVHLE